MTPVEPGDVRQMVERSEAEKYLADLWNLLPLEMQLRIMQERPQGLDPVYAALRSVQPSEVERERDMLRAALKITEGTPQDIIHAAVAMNDGSENAIRLLRHVIAQGERAEKAEAKVSALQVEVGRLTERLATSERQRAILKEVASPPAPLGPPLTTDERTRLLAIERALRARRLGFDDRLELADEIHRVARPIVVTWPSEQAPSVEGWQHRIAASFVEEVRAALAMDAPADKIWYAWLALKGYDEAVKGQHAKDALPPQPPEVDLPADAAKVMRDNLWALATEDALPPVAEPAKPARVIHIAANGRALCEFVDALPSQWPKGHDWVTVYAGASATCTDCRSGRKAETKLCAKCGIQVYTGRCYSCEPLDWKAEADASPAKEPRGSLPIRIGGPDALGWPMPESEAAADTCDDLCMIPVDPKLAKETR